jgi:hypothetical protein
MRRNSLLITESERRQIMSLYGLIKENDNNTTECKINGEVIIKNKNPKHTLISTDIKISLLSGTTTLSETSVDQNNIFNMKVDLKSGDYVLQASGTITFKNEMGEEILRDVDDSSKTTFNVNTLNFGKQKDIKISLNLFLGSSQIKDEVSIKKDKNIKFTFVDSATKSPLKNIDVKITTNEPQTNIKTQFTTDENGVISLTKTIGNGIYTTTGSKQMILNITTQPEGYKLRQEEVTTTAGENNIFTFKLTKMNVFTQEDEDYTRTLRWPKTYKSNFFTIYGHTKTPLENDKEGALELARLDAYSQFLKKVKKKYRENEIVKNAIPEGGEIIFEFPPNQDMYYYIVKYKRSELKKFVKSLLKVKDDVEIEDEPKTNKDLVFEDISLNTALLKSRTQNKDIFILKANDGTNMDNVLKVLNEDKVFVKNTNDTKVRIRIEVDDESEDYNNLVEIFSLNRLSIGGHPQIIYINKDKKILKTYNYYAITTDGKYKL